MYTVSRIEDKHICDTTEQQVDQSDYCVVIVDKPVYLTECGFSLLHRSTTRSCVSTDQQLPQTIRKNTCDIQYYANIELRLRTILSVNDCVKRIRVNTQHCLLYYLMHTDHTCILVKNLFSQILVLNVFAQSIWLHCLRSFPVTSLNLQLKISFHLL